jgi:hypothetical protein
VVLPEALPAVDGVAVTVLFTELFELLLVLAVPLAVIMTKLMRGLTLVDTVPLADEPLFPELGVAVTVADAAPEVSVERSIITPLTDPSSFPV